MKVVQVDNKSKMKQFVYLPKKLHGHNPCYIPPIWLDEITAYNDKNPILSNSTYVLFLLLDDRDEVIGRTIAYIDHNFNEFYKSKIGFFGAFECIDNQEASKLLINSCEEWLVAKNMEKIRGPIHPIAENWGFVIEGVDSPPVYLSPWNPLYYNSFFTKAEYYKVKDLLVYDVDIKKGYTIPSRYETFFNSFKKRYPDITIRRMNMKNIKEDAKIIWELSNISLADNWGFVPLELPVMEDMLKKLKFVVDPDAVWIVEDKGKAVGFCLGFPDINIILKKIKGNLLPFGWAKLLIGAKKLRHFRLFGLAVHPKWQGMGLDAVMFINLYHHLLKKNVRMEANYILEDNFRIKNSLEKLGMSHTKTYRIYEKIL